MHENGGPKNSWRVVACIVSSLLRQTARRPIAGQGRCSLERRGPVEQSLVCGTIRIWHENSAPVSVMGGLPSSAA